MGEKRVVALGKVLGALDARRHPVLEQVMIGIPVLEPLFERALLTVFGELVLKELHALPQKSVVVVKLEHVPRLTGVGELQVVACGLVGSDRYLVGSDVVRMRVA